MFPVNYARFYSKYCSEVELQVITLFHEETLPNIHESNYSSPNHHGEHKSHIYTNKKSNKHK